MRRQRRSTRVTIVSILMGMLMSLGLVAVSSGTANAAEAIPTLKWSPPASVGTDANDSITSPTGGATLPCTTTNGGSNLVTYSATGTLSQNISRTSTIDGVTNCILAPIADKNGDVYGVPFGQTSSGGWSYGSNLLAYSGNTLKWKYAATCTNGGSNAYVVGADGNIYTTSRLSSGDVRLIGLTPNVAAGQTQPTKVLDIDIPDDCSIKLRAYKDGLIIHGQSSGNARYYSYAGKFLGQATIGDVWYEKTNADGMLFTTGSTSGSYTSRNVSMYDPRTGSVKWTTTASTSGANTNDIQVYPVSGGGVAAIVTEQKMESGIPASPTEYVKTLVVINGSGIVTKSQQLTNDYSQSGITGKFTTAYAVADTQGKIVVVRNVNIKTTVSYPTTVPAIALSVYDITNDTWSYQQVMRGDPAKTGGPNGYSLDFNSLERPVGLTNGTIYLTAKCTNNCADYGQKLYAIQVTGLGMDYPRGTVFTANTPTQPTPVPYVALGDSFSSGEGVSPFYPSTDNSGYDMCHRSYSAYSGLIAKNPNLRADLNQGGFWACSGSQTSDILSSQSANNVKNHESAQLGRVNGNTKVITLTIGGNDIGFGNFATACVISRCDSTTTIYATTTAKIQQDLPSQLTSAYEHILAAAGNADVYVLDYPNVVGIKNTTDPQDVRCPYLFDGATPWADAQAARQVVTSINATINNTVTAVKQESADYNSRLHYVNVNGSGSPFAGHGLCDSASSYFMNVDSVTTGNQVYVFHPNADGQAAYALLATTAMTG